jgi:hypothetical protein
MLYHVSGSGLDGGASRALVFLNFPTALAALALLAPAWERVPRAGRVLAVVAAALAAVVFWPGIVRQSDLDARTINAVPAIGVVLALALALAARPAGTAHARGDRLRIALAALLLLAALPWLAADLGFDVAGVPVLGSVFQTAELRSQPGVPGLHPAVHHGHHHGMDGVLLSLTALGLSRAGAGRLQLPLSLYVSLMLAYGLGNFANDFWLEQVIKRGWTTWQVPSVLEPRATWGWAVIVAGAVVVWVAWFRPRREGATAASTSTAASAPAP